MRRKHIYLDIDGVINNADTEEHTVSGYIGIDSVLIDRLKQIIDKTGAKIYLTSTWREIWNNPYDTDYLYMHRVFKENGIEAETLTFAEPKRGAAILDHVHRTNPDAWVVLDDTMFMDFYNEEILPHLVLTSYADGLTAVLMHQAIYVLEN